MTTLTFDDVVLSEAPPKAEPQWLKEARLMKEHPEWYPLYSDVTQMFKDILTKSDDELFPNMPKSVLDSLK